MHYNYIIAKYFKVFKLLSKRKTALCIFLFVTAIGILIELINW